MGVVKISKNLEIGGKNIIIMAGPCAVENEEILDKIAQGVKDGGAHVLRGGAFKPRTSANSFQGLGLEGLKMLHKIGKKYDMPIVTEVMDTRDVDLVNSYADILQIGSRSMQSTPLLKEVGKTDKPILLKRGMSATLKEWLLATEYILQGGNEKIILCERGIRTFETSTRFTLDLNVVPLVKQLSNFPIIVDPSHSTGMRSLITPMSKAAIACGADGLIVEVHCDPDNALCDGEQSLGLEEFRTMVIQVSRL